MPPSLQGVGTPIGKHKFEDGTEREGYDLGQVPITTASLIKYNADAKANGWSHIQDAILNTLDPNRLHQIGDCYETGRGFRPCERPCHSQGRHTGSCRTLDVGYKDLDLLFAPHRSQPKEGKVSGDIVISTPRAALHILSGSARVALTTPTGSLTGAFAELSPSSSTTALTTRKAGTVRLS